MRSISFGVIGLWWQKYNETINWIWAWSSQFMNLDKLPSTTLFAQQIHDMRCKFIARLLVFLQLLMVD